MELRTEILIQAPPSRVWSVLTEFGAYHEWNPFITQIEGEHRQGAELKVTVAPPEGSEQTFRPVLLKFQEGKELRWRGTLGFAWLFSGEHFFLLDQDDSGQQTHLVHGEDFHGLLVKFSGSTLTKVARGFVFMNQALKRRAEGRQ
jgi:hypothetical protein